MKLLKQNILAGIIVILLAVLFLKVNIVKASNQDGFVIENGVLVKYNGPGGDIIIPDGVTKIADNVFNEFQSTHKLKSVTFPNTLKEIGEEAFYGCENLTNITFPKSLEKIGWFAFEDCKNLKQITIPSSLRYFGGGCFLNTPWLTNKRTENEYVVINSVLIDCTLVGPKITIPSNVKVIGAGVHMYMDEEVSEIEEIFISNGVTTIEDGAFSISYKLKKITIPKSVIKISENSFYGDNDLTIYGYSNSYAEKYAKTNDIPFKYVSSYEAASAKSTALMKKIKATGSLTLSKGKSKVIKVTLPSGLSLINLSLTYKSSNTKITTVSNKGRSLLKPRKEQPK